MSEVSDAGAARQSVPLKPLIVFAVTLAGMALVRFVLGWVSLPISWLPFANSVLTALFIVAPILALYQAAAYTWTPKLGVAFLVIGLVLHFGLMIPVRQGVFGMGPLAGAAIAVALSGLVMWCVGIGALIATLIKDKNMLLPIAIFLMAYDAFLVLTPMGLTQQIMKQAPKAFETATYAIPKLSTEVPKGPVAEMARVGPADFLFLAAFFIALFRFKMRTKETLLWILPVLIIYLFVVIGLGGYQIGRVSLSALPALVPIGATVLLVNAREFKVKRDELIATVVIALFGIALVIWGAMQPEPRAAPSLLGPGQASPAPEGSPPPAR